MKPWQKLRVDAFSKRLMSGSLTRVEQGLLIVWLRDASSQAKSRTPNLEQVECNLCNDPWIAHRKHECRYCNGHGYLYRMAAARKAGR